MFSMPRPCAALHVFHAVCGLFFPVVVTAQVVVSAPSISPGPSATPLRSSVPSTAPNTILYPVTYGGRSVASGVEPILLRAPLGNETSRVIRQSESVEGPVRFQTTVSTASPTVTRDRVFVIVEADCDKCERLLQQLERPGGDFEVMRRHGWKIGRREDAHIRIVDKAEVPDILEQVNGAILPAVLSARKTETGAYDVSRSFTSGCTTPLDMWTFHWLITGIDSRPAPAPRLPVTVATGGNYPLRGNHWSVDGDWSPSRDKVLHHLRGPQHVHQIQANWTIESWTYEELRSLHDNLHEAEQGWSASSGSNRASGTNSGPKRYGRTASMR